MKRLEPELNNKAWTTYYEKEDFAGLDMWFEWTVSAYLSRRCAGRFRATREVQAVREQIGGACSQQRVVKGGTHLGGSRGDSSQQIRMTSECGPMNPFGCGLNQGQGFTQKCEKLHYTLWEIWTAIILASLKTRIICLHQTGGYRDRAIEWCHSNFSPGWPPLPWQPIVVISTQNWP